MALKNSKSLLFTVTTLLTLGTKAQNDLGNPDAAGKGGGGAAIIGNYDCIGINPANLGLEKNYAFSIGTLDLGYNIQSAIFTKTSLVDAVLHNNEKFSALDKQYFSKNFGDKNGANLNATATWLATSFYIKKFGGMGIVLRDRAHANIKVNDKLSDIIFNGVDASILQDPTTYSKKISELLTGTKIGYQHTRELNVSYGRRIVGDNDSPLAVYVGAGYKYIWGIADFSLTTDGQTLSGSSSFSSIYGTNLTGGIKNFTPKKTSNLFNNVGTGNAFDIGVTVKLASKFYVSASATDIGKVTWNQNNLFFSDTLMPKLDTSNHGLTSFDIPKQLASILGTKSTLHYKPGNAAYSTTFPAKLRLGAGMRLTDHIKFYADVVAPLNSKALYNIDAVYYAAGTQFNFKQTAMYDIGVAYSKQYGIKIPMGITSGSFNIFQFSVATNDVLFYLGKQQDPSMSYCMGILRINIGNPLSKADNSQ